VKTIRDKYEFLLGNMEVKNSGLLDRLFQDNVLSQEEMESIRSERTSYEQNENLLMLLSRKTTNEFDLFLNALSDTQQQHIRDGITAV